MNEENGKIEIDLNEHCCLCFDKYFMRYALFKKKNIDNFHLMLTLFNIKMLTAN